MNAQDLIKIAAAEVGYLEKKSNSKLDDKTDNAGNQNWTKYARDLSAKGYYNGNKNGFAWCCVFVDWCFLQAANGDKTEAQKVSCQTGDLGAVCTYTAQYYRQQGRLDNQPKVGDQVFFGGEGNGYDHTGIVEKLDGSYIYTIEGNSSDKVSRRQYPRNSTYVRAFGHPLYDGEIETAKPLTGLAKETASKTAEPTKRENTTTVQITTFYLSMGSRGNSVQTLQTLLNYWESAGLEVDGAFGTLTQKAVRAFQKKCGLDVDGIVGKDTWTALINHT